VSSVRVNKKHHLRGLPRKMIEFSEDVLTNVLAIVGGKKFQILLYRFQQEFKLTARSTRPRRGRSRR
jgi:hypothetical protein